MKVAKLKNKDRNPRKISPDQLDKLKESITAFPKMMELRPIVYDPETMQVLGGNQRLAAIKALGMKDIPDEWVKPATELTDAEKQRFVVQDNHQSGEWDFEILEMDFDAELLGDIGIELPEFDVEAPVAQEDDYEIPDDVQTIETNIKRGDIIEIGKHRLMCGDSTDKADVTLLINGQNPDMVFTDPPYNIDYQGVKDKREKIKNDNLGDCEFIQFLFDALSINTETMYVCCSWQNCNLFMIAMGKIKKQVKSFIVWNKVNPAQHLDKYFKQHEIILYYGKFGGEKTLRGDIWEVKREQNTLHPTMKPIELIAIALSDNPNKRIIYDPFIGSGSTMVACHQLDRICFGMEISHQYCQVVVDRMRKLDPDIEIKVNGEIYV